MPAILFAVGSGPWLAASGQEQPPPAVTTADGGELELTVEAIEAQRKKVSEATDIPDDAKAEIDATYQRVLDALAGVSQHQAETQRYNSDAADVQRRVAELKRDLEKVRNQPSTLSISADTPTPLLEQEIIKQEAELERRKAAKTAAEAATTTRTTERQEVRARQLAIPQRLSELEMELNAPAPPNEPPALTTARRAELRAQQQLIRAEIPALQAKLNKFDAEEATDLTRIERDLRTEEASQAEAIFEKLKQLRAQTRAFISAEAIAAAKKEAEEFPDALRAEAEFNVAIAEAAAAMNEPIEQVSRQLEQTKTRLEGVQKQFLTSQKRVKDIGLTGSVGTLLRRQYAELPDVRRRRHNVRARRTLIEETQYKALDYDDQRAEPQEEAARRILAELDPKPTTEVNALLERRKHYLDLVIRTYNAYLDLLFEQDVTEQLLINETEQYESYIEEHVLWIRSNRPLYASLSLDPSDTWLFEPGRWQELGALLVNDQRSQFALYGAALALTIVLLWQKSRLRRELDALGPIAARSTCREIKPTLRAIVLTALLAATWPWVLFFLAWRLNTAANGSLFTRAVADGLMSAAYVFLPIEVMRRICRPNGLADSHFNWPASTTRVFRSNLLWLELTGVFLAFLTTALKSSDHEHGADSVERICFVLGMALLAICAWRLFHPRTGVVSEYFASHTNGWLDRLKPVWYGGLIFAPLGLAGMAIVGYYYTAQQLAWRFYGTATLALVIVVVTSLLFRLLMLHRRRLAMEQHRQAAERSAEASALVEQLVPSEEFEVNITESNQQGRRLIRAAMLAASLIVLWLVWVDVLPALRILDRWPVWTVTVDEAVPSVQASTPPAPSATTTPTPTAGAPAAEAPATATPRTREVLKTVTLADIGLALLVAAVTIVCARNLPGLLEISLLQRLPLEPSIRYAMTSISSYIIVLVGVVVGFNALSIGWSKIQWLATALTFGLAFGLQEIFANFVAGLILLFEQPIRVGDVVTVDEITGVVSRMRIRATTITAWDRKEYVIPNKEFITGRTLNWTLSDKTNRIVINVGVAYGSDTDRAKQLLREACQDHPLTLNDPPPLVTFEGFGDNCLNLVMRTFLPDLDSRLPVIDDLHTKINKTFQEAGIEIAFPQRDLHLRSIDPSVMDQVGKTSK